MNRPKEPAKAHLFVVDDDEAVREALQEVLVSAGYSVDLFATAKDLLSAFRSSPNAQCIIADVRMPEMSGLELLKVLSRDSLSVPIVLITGHGDIPMAVEAMKAGAADFIEKPFSVEEILRAVSSAVGRASGGALQEGRAEIERRYDTLTPREKETLKLIVAGHTNKSAAHLLSISPRTVEVHRAKIMEKMCAKSLADLVRMSIAMNG